MPQWDEIKPETDETTPFAPKLSLTNSLLLLHLVCFLGAAISTALKWPPFDTAISFTAEGAISGWRLWQFVTYTFAHPLELIPMVGSVLLAYLLFWTGNELERHWGWRRLLTFYVCTSIYGAVCHAFFQMIGAAVTVPAKDFFGPVLAIAIANAARNPNRPVLFLMLVPMRTATFVWTTFCITLVLCVLFVGQGASPFAVFGAVAAGYFICRFEPALDRFFDWMESRSERTRFLEEFEVRRTCDEILEKIQHSGMDSLTAHEKRILKRASRLYRDRDDE